MRPRLHLPRHLFAEMNRRDVFAAVRSRRDLGRISQDEIAEMRRKFKIMTRQIEQLKEEIQQKDQVAPTYSHTYLLNLLTYS